MKQYRRALHLIDVRGKYDEGLSMLDKLASADDVLAVPGQSSWMLVHAYRAAVLRGTDFDEEKILNAIRFESKGTAFEASVRSLLSAVSGQSAGLDVEFLLHLVNEIRAETPTSNLRASFGRQALPYAKHIVNDPFAEYSFQTRNHAFLLAYAMLDTPSIPWVAEVLGSQSPWAVETLKTLHRRNNDFSASFLDAEAKDAALSSLMILQPTLTKDRVNVFGAKLLSCLGAQRGGAVMEPTTLAEQGAMELAFEMLQSDAFQDPIELLRRNFIIHTEATADWLVQSLAGWDEWTFQQNFRNLIWNSYGGEKYIVEWARQGSEADLTRLLLTYLPYNPYQEEHIGSETIAWFQKHMDDGGFGIHKDARMNKKPWHNLSPASLQVIQDHASPVDRFLLGFAWLQENEPDHAVLLMQDPGDDPVWAVHLVNAWMLRYSYLNVDTESMPLLLKMASEGPLVEQGKALLLTVGADLLSAEIIQDIGLEVTDDTLHSMLRRAKNTEDTATLQWLIQERTGHDIGRQAGYALSKADPSGLIGMQNALIASGDFPDYSTFVNKAWDAMTKSMSKEDFLAQKETLMTTARAIPANAHADELFLSLLRVDQDLALQVFLDGYSEEARHSILREVDSRNNFSAANGDAELTSRIVQECAENDIWQPFHYIRSFLVNNLSTTSPSAIPALQILWDDSHLSKLCMPEVVEMSIRQPELREAMRGRIEAGLQNSDLVFDIATSLQRWGAVEEFLPTILLSLEGDLPETRQAMLLTTISTLDRPAVIQALMEALNDPRPQVSTAASSGLSRIQKLRKQRAEWQAWSNGTQLVSPVVALMEDLNDPSIDIRIAAIQSLGTLGDKAALPVLVDLLRDDNTAIKEAAAAALARINAAPVLQED